MPTKLSEPPEELLRQFLVDNLTPSEMEGYDPNQTDPTQSDFLPISDDWNYGPPYPFIFIGTAGDNLPGGGDSGFAAIKGDGSGPVQPTQSNVTVAVQADTDESYRNSVSASSITYSIAQEITEQVQDNNTTGISEGNIEIGPWTKTTSESEDDSGSTVTWLQRQTTLTLHWINDP